MIPVYICEDDEIELESFRKLITKIITAENLKEDIEIICVEQDPLAVIKKAKEDTRTGIFFLDVDLGKGVMNGIELGMNIKIINPSAYITMVTTHAEAAPLTYKYKLGIKDYIMKDNPGDLILRFKECLKDGHKFLSVNKHIEPKVVFVRRDGNPCAMYANQIYFIEAVINTPRRVWIHEEFGQTEVISTLNDIKNQLSRSFYQCHKSYIINTNYIKEIDKKTRTVHLDNGCRIPISIRCLYGLEKHYLESTRH